MSSGLGAFEKKVGKQVVRPSWLTIKNGQTARVSFLLPTNQFPRVVEHSSPDDWQKRAVCTYDEENGQCYACEQRAYKWNQNIKIYVPVLMNRRPFVIVQGVGVNSLFHSLVQHERIRGTIRDVAFDVSRKGEGRRSAYSSEPTNVKTPPYKAKVDINQLINHIEYNHQKTYYQE